jgi:hypothetical protein
VTWYSKNDKKSWCSVTGIEYIDYMSKYKRISFLFMFYLTLDLSGDSLYHDGLLNSVPPEYDGVRLPPRLN